MLFYGHASIRDVHMQRGRLAEESLALAFSGLLWLTLAFLASLAGFDCL